MKILVVSKTIPTAVLESGRNLVRAFFSGAEIAAFSLADHQSHEHVTQAKAFAAGIIEIEHNSQLEGLSMTATWHSFSLNGIQPEEKITLTPFASQAIWGKITIGREQPLTFILKHALYRILVKVTDHPLPWGILTGIRPTKLVHKMNDLGMAERDQREVLRTRYAVREDKAQLLLGVAKTQEPFLKEMEAHPEKISIYIGIPFCPSRCSYCSFPGFTLSRTGMELEEYLKALFAEVRVVGELMGSLGLVADSIYLGGGTPTILSEIQLDLLLGKVYQYLPLDPMPEITVEGGRPETLSPTKLRVMHDRQVSRLSINPQTMNDETLKRVGRSHRVKDIYQSYELARNIGQWTINMDLILGLPGEGLKEMEATLKQLEHLRPDNLTVHVLALKRGSQAKEEDYRHTMPSVIEQMEVRTKEKAEGWGFHPYYLYRQKEMAGNLENIGYALPGKECRYNIAIMEERQTVLGIGAGASSKTVNPSDYSLQTLIHPSAWKTYVNRWLELHHKRSEMLLGIQ